jgi:hypothetical protein
VGVGRAGRFAQVAKALHHRFGASTRGAPFPQHGYFAEQVHRDFDAVKQLSLRAAGTIKEAFNHALNLAFMAPETQRKFDRNAIFRVTAARLDETLCSVNRRPTTCPEH